VAEKRLVLHGNQTFTGLTSVSEAEELEINRVRVFGDGDGAWAFDAVLRVAPKSAERVP